MNKFSIGDTVYYYDVFEHEVYKITINHVYQQGGHTMYTDNESEGYIDEDDLYMTEINAATALLKSLRYERDREVYHLDKAIEKVMNKYFKKDY